jgi:hypothetical protein
MNKVYAVGVMQIDLTKPHPLSKSQRLRHFFAHFEDAERCVLQNLGDMFENYYNIALIEEHWVYDPQDIVDPLIVAQQWWYQAQFFENSQDPDDIYISKIDPPATLQGICNYWAG